MKKIVLLLTIALLSVFCFSAFGCAQDGGYTVNFVLTCQVEVNKGEVKQVGFLWNGKSNVDTLHLKNGDKIADLDQVTCTQEGYKFVGWRWKDKTITSATVFSEEVFGKEKDIVLQVCCSDEWSDFT